MQQYSTIIVVVEVLRHGSTRGVSVDVRGPFEVPSPKHRVEIAPFIVRSMYLWDTYSKSMDQPGKVANPARGQVSRKNEYFSVRVRA